MRSDFDGFYHANFGDIVAMAYGYTAELSEAQDIAQEAFCRAWQRWQRVSRYDNPVTWVRRVAINIAHSRWRQARRTARHVVRQRVEPVPGADPDHVAAVVRFGGPTPDPIQPTPGPVPSPSISPDDPALSLDLFRVTLQFRQQSEGCLTGGPHNFEPDPLNPAEATDRDRSRSILAQRARLADVTGDGRAEVVMTVLCRFSTYQPRDTGFTGVFAVEADRTLRQIGIMPAPLLWAENGLTYIDRGFEEPGKVEALHWDGPGFVSRADSEAYPAIKSLELDAVAEGLACQGLPSRPDLRLEFGDTREAVQADRVWGISGTWMRLGGKPHYLVTLTCRRTDKVVVGPDLQQPHSLSLLPLEHTPIPPDRTGRWKVLSHIRIPAAEWGGPHVNGECFTIRTAEETPYRWNGKEFEMGGCPS